MKKTTFYLFFILLLCFFAGCTSPDSMQLSVYNDAEKELKLLHLNASSSEKKQKIEAVYRIISDAEPIEKDLSLFAFYPDFAIDILMPENKGETVSVVLDLNDEYIDFYYPGPYPAADANIYRSSFHPDELKKIIHDY
jgi:Type III secretory pathway, lipoprotein EscJ